MLRIKENNKENARFLSNKIFLSLNLRNPFLEIYKLKGIGRGVHLDFYKLILFYRVLSKLSDILTA